MQRGDTITETEVSYVEQLERLWGMVSDAVESGRLRETSLPDDYAALVQQMIDCEGARVDAQQEASDADA